MNMTLPAGLPVTSYTPITPATSANSMRNAYAESLDPVRQALMLNYILLTTEGLATYNAALGQALLSQAMDNGLPIDPAIDILGMDPYTTMMSRIASGCSWTYSLGMSWTAPTPQDPFHGWTGPMPPGGLIVSVDPADFPKYNPPTPPTPPEPAHCPVGQQIPGTNLWEISSPDTVPVGGAWAGTWVGTNWMTGKSFTLTGTWTKQYWGQPSMIGGSVAQVYAKTS